MLGVNKTKFLVRHKSCECKCGLNVIVFNSKQKWNHHECRCECKKLDDWVSCKKDYMYDPSTCHCECNKAHKIDEYLDIKKCLCKKRLFGKLVLECEDETLNTTENLLNDKRVAFTKSDCFSHNISLIIMCLLLLVVICYFYCTKYRSK